MQPLVEILPNGCELFVLQQPRATRAAMAVQFSIGSHHAPDEWPGLAHFLEHLLFLGGEHFLGAQRLMPYVQGGAGQVNATTAGTATQFYFETPPSHFQGAAERLLDMLTRPRLALDDQFREREVIDAEYRARAADAVQLGLSCLQQALAPNHPLSGFHAGNRSTLAVDDPAFQAALRSFHSNGYRASLARVVLVGPQSLDDLLTQGRQWGRALPTGSAALRQIPALPIGSQSAWQLQLEGTSPRLWLGIRLPAVGAPLKESCQAIALMLGSRLPGSLSDQLIACGCALDLVVHRLYDSPDEAVLGVEVELTDPSAASVVKAAVADWLRFLGGAIGEGAPLALMERPLAALTPLQSARQCLLLPVNGACWLPPGLRAVLQRMLEGAASALTAVLASDTASGQPREACGFAVRMGRLELKPAQTRLRFETLPFNPLSKPLELVPARQPVSLVWYPRAGSEAVLFLRCRWGGEEAPPRGALRLTLRGVMAAAEQLGARLTLEETGGAFSLRCSAEPEQLPTLIWHLVDALRKGTAKPLKPVVDMPDEMPLRRLLRRLPDWLQRPLKHGALSQWDGLLLGLEEPAMRCLSGALGMLPAAPLTNDQEAERVSLGRHVIQCRGDDAAVLLFYPLLERRAETEAAWRVLGQWLAPRFYQRVRGELQLGYGVFCGFHQVGGQCGVLFAVQSPSASCDVLIGHVEAFIEEQQARLAEIDDVSAHELALAESARLGEVAHSIEAEADFLWQAYLADLQLDHPGAVQRACAVVSRQVLLAAAGTLVACKDARLVLCSR